MKKTFRKRTLGDEITDAESKDQHESVSLSISMIRGLYLHALYAVRDGDYSGLSAYISDLVRREKKRKTT
jgi:hypothetical protein